MLEFVSFFFPSFLSIIILINELSKKSLSLDELNFKTCKMFSKLNKPKYYGFSMKYSRSKLIVSKFYLLRAYDSGWLPCKSTKYKAFLSFTISFISSCWLSKTNFSKYVNLYGNTANESRKGSIFTFYSKLCSLKKNKISPNIKFNGPSYHCSSKFFILFES